jgi:hypothetical protein
MHAVYLRRPHLGVDHTAPERDRTPSDVHNARDLWAVDGLARQFTARSRPFQ